VVELALCSVMKEEPFYFEEFNVGVDLSEASMINFKGTDFAAYLCKASAPIAHVETIKIAKKKSSVGREAEIGSSESDV
jgi:hypothetical protein